MERRTAAAILLVVVVLGGVALFGVVQLASDGGHLSEQWVSDTATSIQGNHHAPAVGTVDGSGVLFAPISGAGDTAECALVALDARDGDQRWRYGVPPGNCTLHAVADPTVADFTGDGDSEVLAATTEQVVTALGARTGDVEFRQNLSSYGYTRPIVGDLDRDGTSELVVVDVRGTVLAVEPDGTVLWRDRFDAYTWGQPAIVDVDGARRVVVGLGDGRIRAYDASGGVRWNRSDGVAGDLTWMATVDPSDRDATSVAVATADGVVALFDGRSGDRIWRRDVGQFAAIHAAGDGDGDGRQELYAVARDGRLRSLDATDGTVEWTTTLTTADVQMMPPPSMGDLDGDGDPELVAPGHDGTVSVVEPGSGDVLATYERDVSIYTHSTVADGDGDGEDEAYVIYGDGRVVALEYASR